MDAQFVRERLFRPFISTKGETGTSGMGIGAFQTREYVQQLGGELEVQSIPGKGTVFCMLLPLMDDEVSDAPVRPLKAATPGSPT
jgi:signal transduction histidine kinase